MTYRELINSCPDVSDREALLRGIMNWSLGEFLRYVEDEAAPETVMRFQNGVERLRSHEPLQYILGEAPFYGRMFKVDRRVLIPRFDTEILLQDALQKILELKANGVERPRVLDLCTGSGCIAWTLAAEIPGAEERMPGGSRDPKSRSGGSKAISLNSLTESMT